MQAFKDIFFQSCQQVDGDKVCEVRNLPSCFKELVKDLKEVNLSEHIWFPYIKNSNEEEYCFSQFYGLSEIENVINDWALAFSINQDELFFYPLLPFANEDGHTGLAFSNTDTLRQKIFFIDYEWQDYYFVADSFEEFIEKCYIKNRKYTYNISEITEDLLSILNRFLLENFHIDHSISKQEIVDSFDNVMKPYFRSIGKVAISIKPNKFPGTSSYRECFAKEAELILTIIPKGRVTDNLSNRDLLIYERLHHELTTLDGVNTIRKYGKTRIYEYVFSDKKD